MVARDKMKEDPWSLLASQSGQSASFRLVFKKNEIVSDGGSQQALTSGFQTRVHENTVIHKASNPCILCFCCRVLNQAHPIDTLYNSRK